MIGVCLALPTGENHMIKQPGMSCAARVIRALLVLCACAALVQLAAGAPKILSDKQLEQALTEGRRVLLRISCLQYHILSDTFFQIHRLLGGRRSRLALPAR